MCPSLPLLFLFSLHSCGANVTNLILKACWGPVECGVMLIVSQQSDWIESHEAAEAIYPFTFDLYLSSLCVCPCWLYRTSRLHGVSSVCIPPPHPPLYTQADKTLTPDACMPIQRHTWMFAYQYIHQNRHITFQRTDSLAYFFKHITHWLSALDC